MNMDANEEYVRSKWKAISNEGTRRHPLIKLCGAYIQRSGEWDEGWSTAAEFTRQREEEILDVNEEIKLIEKLRDERDWYAAGWEKIKRILAREQAALAELKRGMK